MKLVINGKDTQSKDNLSVTELLAEQEIKVPDMISVEINGSILQRTEFDNTSLKEGDKVEVLYFMGGGNVIN